MINLYLCVSRVSDYTSKFESSLQLSFLLSIPVSTLSQWELQDDHTSVSSEVNSTFGQVSAAQGYKKQGIIQSEGYSLRLQSLSNNLMHAMNGNAVLRLDHTSSQVKGFLELQLDELIPHIPFKYSPQEILQYRSVSSNPIHGSSSQSFRSLPIVQTTVQFRDPCPHARAKHKGRSGTRRRHQDPEGVYHNYKPRNGRRPTIHNNSKNSAGKASNTAATRHAGSPLGANEECTPQEWGEKMRLGRGPINVGCVGSPIAAGVLSTNKVG